MLFEIQRMNAKTAKKLQSIVRSLQLGLSWGIQNQSHLLGVPGKQIKTYNMHMGVGKLQI